MSSNKKIRSLTKKLKELEKIYGKPKKPAATPASLYVKEIVEQQNFGTLGLGSQRQELIKQVYKQANEDWKKLDPTVRRVYVAESQKIRDEYRERKRDWLTIFGGSKAWDQMEQIKADIKLLKDLKP